MSTLTVTTIKQLKAVLKCTTASAVVVENKALSRQLMAVKGVKQAGPWAVAAIATAISFAPVTGGASIGIAAGSISGKIGVSSAALIAIGGTIILSVCTDWKVIKFGEFVRLER